MACEYYNLGVKDCPLSLTVGISYPLITLHLIKIYPKHRKITKHFIKEYVFREYDGAEEKRLYED
jgi:hypothetical protein